MRLSALLLTAIALLLPASSSTQDQADHPDRDHAEHDQRVPTRRFDGKWQTTVSCDPSRGALGFSYRFISEVRDGQFHGVRGTEGEPSSLLIDGTIEDDGTGKLYASGFTGSKEFVPGVDTPRGTSFGYHVRAHFDEKHGDGTRIEGRPCTLEFDRMDRDDHHEH
jgi:hypothetical protein